MFKVSKPEMVNKTFRMPVELVERLNVVAQAQKVSLNKLVCQCCEYALDNLSAQKEDAKLSVNIYQSEQSSIESGSISYSIPIIEYSTVAHSDHWVEYSCCTALDMVVSIMHYYALNGYKMAVCRHCGRGFVTTNFKQLYCGRISSYQNRFSQKRSSPKTCEETVRQTIQFLRAEKNAVIRRAAANYDVHRCSGKGSEFYNRLVSECDTYMDEIKHEPTPQNFDKFGQFLFETNQKKEWKR